MADLVWLGIANGMISLCIAKSKFFGWFRERLLMRSANPIYNFLWELFSCAYCLSHWIAFVLVALLPSLRIVHHFALLDFLVTMFVNVAIANITWVLVFGLEDWATKDK